MKFELPTTDAVIGEKVFRITTLPFGVGRSVQLKLAKIVGPALSSFAGETNEAKVLDAISSILDGLDEKTYADLIDTFCAHASFLDPETGEPLLLKIEAVKNRAFAGDYGTLTKFLTEALKVNFSSFFADLVSVING